MVGVIGKLLTEPVRGRLDLDVAGSPKLLVEPVRGKLDVPDSRGAKDPDEPIGGLSVGDVAGPGDVEPRRFGPGLGELRGVLVEGGGTVRRLGVLLGVVCRCCARCCAWVSMR